jgi:hypothetical protein
MCSMSVRRLSREQSSTPFQSSFLSRSLHGARVSWLVSDRGRVGHHACRSCMDGAPIRMHACTLADAHCNLNVGRDHPTACMYLLG